ncbi:MAG: cell wall-binding repeat-containing protein, partial [Nakamurella sp.]
MFGAADAVVIANGENYKQGFDALAANYLAGQVGASILLTQGGRLPPETLAAVCSVLKGSTAASKTIYILGGTDSVSPAVATALSKPCTPVLGNVRVVRIGGADRYATAAMIATGAFGASGNDYPRGIGVFALGGEKPLRTAIVASGEANADALSAGGIAAQFHLPMLLTAAGSLPDATAKAITTLKIEQVIVLGGPDRVSQKVKGQLTALGVRNIVTIAGQDRFETSALLGTLA